jgi:hypothetical protein
MERFPKAAAFGALSWFILCRVAKNEHPCRYSALAQLCARQNKKLFEV